MKILLKIKIINILFLLSSLSLAKFSYANEQSNRYLQLAGLFPVKMNLRGISKSSSSTLKGINRKEQVREDRLNKLLTKSSEIYIKHLRKHQHTPNPKIFALWKLGKYLTKKQKIYEKDTNIFFLKLSDKINILEDDLIKAAKFHKSFPLISLELGWDVYAALLDLEKPQLREKIFSHIINYYYPSKDAIIRTITNAKINEEFEKRIHPLGLINPNKRKYKKEKYYA